MDHLKFIASLYSERQINPTDRWIVKVLKLVPLEAAACISISSANVEVEFWYLQLGIFLVLLLASIYLLWKKLLVDVAQISIMSISFAIWSAYMSRWHLHYALSFEDTFLFADIIKSNAYVPILLTASIAMSLIAPGAHNQLRETLHRRRNPMNNGEQNDEDTE